MRRTPLKPGKGFKPKLPPPRPVKTTTYTPRPREAAVRVNDGRARMVVQVPKAKAWRSEEYRRLVASLPCAHCGRPGPSQAAHADSAGKGMGIKSPDSELMPLCADSPGRMGCHQLISGSGLFTKEHRRILERQYVQATKALLGKFDE